MSIAWLLAQAANAATQQRDWVDSVIEFLDTPAPYSPLSEYLLVMLLLWLLARSQQRKPPSFDEQAQEALDEKFRQGELSEKAYEKYRQDLSLRPKP
jgi:hypothetical protein